MSWYKIKAKGAKSAEISIYGDIGESWWGESITAKQFVTDLNALDVEQLTIRINSYGGSVSDGLAIFNAIKRHKAATTTSIDGVAVSIASLIAMAGDNVEIADNAMLMIHAPWTYAQGNAVDLREAADVLDKYASAMSSSYANKTGKTIEAVMSWLTDGVDHWFTAAEALAENLVDKITDAQPVAASFNLNRYKNVPAVAGIFNKPSAITETFSEIFNQSQTEQSPMPAAAQTTNTPAPDPVVDPQQPTAALNAAEIAAKALAQDKQRREAIRARFAPFVAKKIDGVDTILNACLDDHAITVQAAAERLMDKLGEGIVPTAGNYATRIESGETQQDKFAKGVGQSIMARAGKEKHDPSNEFRGFRLEDMARSALEMAGVNARGMDRLTMIKAALRMRPSGYGQTTSDFPVLLENVMHRMVLTAYQTAPDTWTKWCKQGSVTDFREWQRLRFGSISDLEAVNEAGEYKHGALPDAAKEGISVKRRGKIIEITPEVIMNDDIGFISDTTTNLGRAAKRTIETQAYAYLVSNPVLKDGVALFHADHLNLAGTAAAPSVTSLDLARVAMKAQKDLSSNEYLDIFPDTWLGPNGIGGDVRVIVGAQYDPDTANKLQRPNKVNGLVQNIVDTPRLSGTAWYLFADPNIAPVIEVAFLDGQTEPQLAMEENFTTAGVAYRVELPFGVGVIGYAGAYRNDGA